MSRIRRMLTIHTSLGPLANYTLQATVPPHLLSRCSSALPRPHWEPVLYYSIMCIMSFLFLCICLAAYFEGDRIIMADIIRRKLKVSNSTQTFDKGKVFDLRNVAGLSLSPPKSSSAISSLSSSAVGQDLRAAAAKSMIHVNGHVEFHPQTNGHQPLLGRIISIARRLNPGRLFSGSSKTPVLKTPPKVTENNTSSPDKEPDVTLTRTNSGKSASNAEHGSPSLQPSPAQEAAMAADKAYTNHVKPTKKSKASKRHLVDSANVVSSSAAQEDCVDYKLTKDSSIPSAAKKMAEADDDPRDRSTASEAADDYLDDDVSPKMDLVHSSRLPSEFFRLLFSSPVSLSAFVTIL